MFRWRFITTLILVPLMVVAVLYLPLIWFGVLFALLALLAAKEWFALIFESPSDQIIWVVITFFVLIIYLSLPTRLLLLLGLMIWLFAFFSVLCSQKKCIKWIKPLWLRATIGVILISLCWISLLFLKKIDAWALLVFLLIIWGADIGAYIVGKLFGKHKLAPNISPGKTWEGVLGGFLLGLLVAFLSVIFMSQYVTTGHWATFVLSHPKRWSLWFTIILISLIFSVLGDLFESLLKRMQGVKDSGYLLPGHGGLLDRVDSLLAASPVYAFGLSFLEYLR